MGLLGVCVYVMLMLLLILQSSVIKINRYTLDSLIHSVNYIEKQWKDNLIIISQKEEEKKKQRRRDNIQQKPRDHRE